MVFIKKDERNNIEICLIQEPWIVNNEIKGLNIKNYLLFYLNTDMHKRSCILLRDSLKGFLLEILCTGDITTIVIESI